MAKVNLKHSGAVIDKQIDRVIDGSVVVDNTLSALDLESKKPVDSKAVKTAIEETANDLVTPEVLEDELAKYVGKFVTTEVEVGHISEAYPYNPPTKGFITFVTDDGNTQDYSLYLPLFREKGEPFTTAVIVNKVGTEGFATLAQLQEIVAAGNEVISHTMSHPHLSELPESDVIVELRDSHEWLVANGFNGDVVAFPYGYWGEREKRIASRYFKAARCSDMGLNGLNESPIETFELKAIWLDPDYVITASQNRSGYASNTLEFYKFYIDEAVANNSWLIIGTHSGTISHHPDLVAMLEDVIDYAKEKSEIVTFKTALDSIANIVEVGAMNKLNPSSPHAVIGYDGKIHTNSLPCIYKEMNAIDGATAFADLDNYSETICFVNTERAGATSLPTGYAGILRSSKFNDISTFRDWRRCNIQRYTTIGGKEYYRYPNTDGSWSEWKDTANYTLVLGEISSTQFDASISTYSKGLSIAYINGANGSAVSPSKGAGMLITFRVDNTSTMQYNTQIFIAYGSPRIYARKANGNAWTKWEEKGSNSYITDVNAYDCATAISTFDFGITYTPINTATATASNAPESKAGTLITYKVSTDPIYDFQEYRIIMGSKSYRRGFASDGTPTVWVKFCE